MSVSSQSGTGTVENRGNVVRSVDQAGVNDWPIDAEANPCCYPVLVICSEIVRRKFSVETVSADSAGRVQDGLPVCRKYLYGSDLLTP